jgi:hypothetical protein
MDVNIAAARHNCPDQETWLDETAIQLEYMRNGSRTQFTKVISLDSSSLISSL